MFAQAREKARQTACLSNTKQLSSGMMMYGQDYDEVFPASLNGASQRWVLVFHSYTKNKQINDCPSASFKTNTTSGSTSSYGYNRQTFDFTPVAAIAEPAGTIIFGDAARLSGAPTSELDPSTWKEGGSVDHDMHFPARNPSRNICWRWAQSTCDSNNYRRPFPRHQQMANLAFADGHSKAMRVDQVIKRSDGTAMSWGEPNCLFDDK